MPLRIQLVGDDLHNFLTKSNQELYELYEPYYGQGKTTQKKHEIIRRTANKLRRKNEAGKLPLPERSEPFDSKTEHQKIAERASDGNPIGEMIGELVDFKVPADKLQYFEQLKDALDEHGALESVRIRKGEHTVVTKDAEGNVETTIAPNQQLEFKCSFKPAEPKWTPIHAVKSEILKQKVVKVKKDFKTCMVLPDIQLPYEDKYAIDVVMAVMEDLQPDMIVSLGDFLDLAPFSKFLQHKNFASSTQEAIDRGHLLLARIRKIVPHATIAVMAGNHEERLPTYVLTNAMAAFGLRRANRPEDYAVGSVPDLLSFNDLDVKFIPGYPGNRIWLNKNLQIRHGVKTGKNGMAARSTSASERMSTIQGHDHRLSMHSTTINEIDGGKLIYTYGAGCLCSLSGDVPSVYQGHDLEDNPIYNYEDWSQGFVVATYDEEHFHVEQIPINTFNNYQTLFRGKIYQPKEVRQPVAPGFKLEIETPMLTQ